MQTPIPGLRLYRRTAPSIATCQVYEPALALVAQGAKKVEVGGTTYAYGEASWLLTPLGVPAISRFVKASAEKPYFACALLLDLSAAREVVTKHEVLAPEAPHSKRAVTTGPLLPTCWMPCFA